MRVGIIGIGNCCSSLVQGVHYYRNAKVGDLIPGLMHVNLGGYHINDVEFTVAIDVDKNKVGKDLAQAIATEPNNTVKFDVGSTSGYSGKSLVSMGLGFKFKKDGLRVGYIKPVGILPIKIENILSDKDAWFILGHWS